MTNNLIAELEAWAARADENNPVGVVLTRAAQALRSTSEQIMNYETDLSNKDGRIAELEEALKRAEVWVPKPPIMQTYRSDEHNRPVSRPLDLNSQQVSE